MILGNTFFLKLGSNWVRNGPVNAMQEQKIHGLRRGGVTKDKTVARPVTVWFRNADIALIQQAVTMLDTDCSKFLRSAVREKCAKVLAPGGS